MAEDREQGLTLVSVELEDGLRFLGEADGRSVELDADERRSVERMRGFDS